MLKVSLWGSEGVLCSRVMFGTAGGEVFGSRCVIDRSARLSSCHEG